MKPALKRFVRSQVKEFTDPGPKVPANKQAICLEHYRNLLEAKRKAEQQLQQFIGDLLAFELVLRKPVVWHDWPGGSQSRIRAQLLRLENGSRP